MNLTLNHCYEYGMEVCQRVAVSVLKKGTLPKHVGYIMDGNRRFARKLGATSTLTGHYEGFRRINKIVLLCHELGIFEVTGFGFSLENFHRSQDEVDYLMDLFRDIFGNFHSIFPIVKKHGIQVQVPGQLDALPKDLAISVKKVVEETKNFENGRWNICLPYTSRDEMTTSIQKNIQMVVDGDMDLMDISQKTIEEHLATSLPLDLLVRTSGETRLSDFLLLQATRGCQIQFIDCYWPEITIWKMLHVFLEYLIYSDYIPK